jgi:hypothetical protein
MSRRFFVRVRVPGFESMSRTRFFLSGFESHGSSPMVRVPRVRVHESHPVCVLLTSLAARCSVIWAFSPVGKHQTDGLVVRVLAAEGVRVVGSNVRLS